MSEEDAYAQAEIALQVARRIMFAHRLTYSRVQVRLREAAMEQAEAQAADLEARGDALAPLVAADAHRVAALTAAVEQLRVRAVAVAVGQILTELTAIAEAIGTQVAQLRTDLHTAVALAERAQQYANTLSAGHLRERVAANEAAERLRAMVELTQLLHHLMGEHTPPDP